MTVPTAGVVPCAGVPIRACTPEQARDEVISAATAVDRQGMAVHLCNAYTLAIADRQHEFKNLLGRAGANYPDGTAVVWANRFRNRDLDLPRVRVYGPDLFLDVFEAGQACGIRHYLLGGSPEVLTALEAELLRRFPAARIVGRESPPFRALTDAERRAQGERIAASGAQIVWVGLGTPKQDWEAQRLADESGVVAVAVGAAFDFVAGAKRQAPAWMQRNGLEWLFRLASEPRRLWRRYLVGNVRFVRAVMRGST